MLKSLPSKMVRRGLLAVLGLLVLLLSAAFFFPQQVLCVDSGNVQADVLVVLGGGSYEWPIRAAELFRAGAAPRSKRPHWPVTLARPISSAARNTLQAISLRRNPAGSSGSPIAPSSRNPPTRPTVAIWGTKGQKRSGKHYKWGSPKAVGHYR